MIVRADKGFYHGSLVRWLEEKRAHFVIVARPTPPIKARLAGLRYGRVSPGVTSLGI